MCWATWAIFYVTMPMSLMGCAVCNGACILWLFYLFSYLIPCTCEPYFSVYYGMWSITYWSKHKIIQFYNIAYVYIDTCIWCQTSQTYCDELDLLGSLEKLDDNIFFFFLFFLFFLFFFCKMPRPNTDTAYCRYIAYSSLLDDNITDANLDVTPEIHCFSHVIHLSYSVCPLPLYYILYNKH